MLGSPVFRHLARLHLRYFEQCPTSTLIARMHGVETIRQFISGATVTLFLDLPFLLIFDEAASGPDQQTAEHFAQTINQLKGRVTTLFIAHHFPQTLKVDEVPNFSAPAQGPGQPTGG